MLAVNQENEKLMEEYEKLASEVRWGPERAAPSSTCALPRPGSAEAPPPLLQVAMGSPAASCPLLPSKLPPFMRHPFSYLSIHAC